MAEVTIYAEQDGGQHPMGASTWEDLLERTSYGIGWHDIDPTYIRVLSAHCNEVYQQHLRFDTSTNNIPSGATITSVTFVWSRAVWGGAANAGDFEVYINDWWSPSGAFENTDIVSYAEAGSLYSGGYRVATSPAVTNSDKVVAMTFTSESDFADHLNRSGYTVMTSYPANWRTGTATSVTINVHSQFCTTEAYRPRLIVTYSLSASPTGSYHIQSHGTASPTGSFHIQSHGTGSPTGSWHIRSTLNASSTGSYHVLSGFSSSSNGSWHVTGKLMESKDGSYHIRAGFTASPTGSYHLVSVFSGSPTGSWHIQSAQLAQVDGSYSLSIVGGASSTGSYHIQRRGFGSPEGSFHIASRASANVNGAWFVGATFAAGVSGAWHVATGVLRNADGSWHIRKTQRADFQGSFWKSRRHSSNKTGSWCILVQRESDSSGSWNVTFVYRPFMTARGVDAEMVQQLPNTVKQGGDAGVSFIR